MTNNPVNDSQILIDAEAAVQDFAAELTAIRPGECLLCYVWRMLEFGCTDLRWSKHYRDVRAPQATGLERRLARRGGYCDCEIFMNGYRPAERLWTRPEAEIVDGVELIEDAAPPEVMPACEGAAPGSVTPCALWVAVR